MGRKKVSPILLPQPGLDQLKLLCSALNTKNTVGGPEFRRLTAIWLDSGPNLQAMMKANLGLEQQLRGAFRVEWIGSKTGRAHFVLLPDPDPRDWVSHGRVFFVTLTLHPECERLRVCKNCLKYFVQKSGKQTTYCSRRCGASLTAKEQTKRKREETHRKKLEQARLALEEWRRTGMKMPYLKWIKTQPKTDDGMPGPSFTTRALNKGELELPKK